MINLFFNFKLFIKIAISILSGSQILPSSDEPKPATKIYQEVSIENSFIRNLNDFENNKMFIVNKLMIPDSIMNNKNSLVKNPSRMNDNHMVNPTRSDTLIKNIGWKLNSTFH